MRVIPKFHANFAAVSHLNATGKAERKREQSAALGKLFYDLGKLTFAALVPGAALMYFQADELETLVTAMFVSGTIVSLAFTIVGNKLREPLKIPSSALRSLGKMLIYFSKLRFCLSHKP